ncbi:CAP domain-containing protein [Methylopila sp. M107]|uniref:CAP domain-containing protein n=1 Tax=Methylopila sp. M107 TaxID=1101190 RepID=UPI00036A592E|nr:CAP domain-containing protein [Methylopila sp. M107]
MPPIALRASIVLTAVGLALAGCSTDAPAPQPPRPSTGGSSLYQSQSRPGATLDRQAAADMISELRRTRGLAPVSLDATLDRMAEQQAAAMARSDKLSHATPAGGSFKQRIAGAGYRNGGMWENIGGGHDTLADAFTGWRSSPPHLKNMLQPGVKRIGIAAVRAPGTRFEVFWALVMADPADPRQAAAHEPAAAPPGDRTGALPGGLMAGNGEPR